MPKLLYFFNVTAVGAALVFLLAASGPAQSPVPSPTVSKQDRENIEKIVREYLIAHPEVLREAMQALQDKEELEKRQTTAQNLKKLSSQIYSDAESPVLGNAHGSVSVVVFYDYFCGYCRKTIPGLADIIAKEKDVRFIYKELPILGPDSITAARAALAAERQGKFAAFHKAMISAESASDKSLRAIAEKLGLDYVRMQKDMADPKIAEAIGRTMDLATALNIEGTPAYLVGDEFIPGAITSESLSKIIANERAKLTRGGQK
jgi:protein-disulfide isomerase